MKHTWINKKFSYDTNKKQRQKQTNIYIFWVNLMMLYFYATVIFDIMTPVLVMF